jgi:hypothetical protein
MNLSRCIRQSVLSILTLGLALSSTALAVQTKSKKKEQPGTPVLWREPTDISTRDLFLGPGGEESKPDLSQVIWDKQETDEGYSVKWRVRDASGKFWVVKLGNEAQPETVAVRLVWAVGYVTEVNYLVPCVQIVNAPKTKKKVERCEGKGYANVRFEARPESVKRLNAWNWRDNPFAGTKELQGLVVLLGLLNDWDLKDVNNKVLFVPGGEGGEDELRYIVSDLGATFGKTGNFVTHSRNEPENFVKSGFVQKVDGGKVKFDYHGKNGGLFDDITVEQAKWIGDLLAQLSEQQIADAFRAANYPPQESAMLTAAVRARIAELTSLTPPASLGQGR